MFKWCITLLKVLGCQPTQKIFVCPDDDCSLHIMTVPLMGAPWWNWVPELFPSKNGLALRPTGISRSSCLLTMKITLCTIIACVHFQFLEQVHGQKVAVGLYLKIITAFQDFSYLFDEMLVQVDGARNWQRGNLLIPIILLCSATSCESPHSPVSSWNTLHSSLFISFVCVGFKLL